MVLVPWITSTIGALNIETKAIKTKKCQLSKCNLKLNRKHTVLRVDQNSPEVERNWHFKGIDRPFGGRVKSRLFRSLLINWRLGNFFLLILNGVHHKINKKPIVAA
jgi:hypothetical protein